MCHFGAVRWMLICPAVRGSVAGPWTRLQSTQAGGAVLHCRPAHIYAGTCSGPHATRAEPRVVVLRAKKLSSERWFFCSLKAAAGIPSGGGGRGANLGQGPLEKRRPGLAWCATSHRIAAFRRRAEANLDPPRERSRPPQSILTCVRGWGAHVVHTITGTRRSGSLH